MKDHRTSNHPLVLEPPVERLPNMEAQMCCIDTGVPTVSAYVNQLSCTVKL